MFNLEFKEASVPGTWNTKRKRDSRCLHNSVGVIKTREAVHARTQLSGAGNQISLVTVFLSSVHRSCHNRLSYVYAGISEVGDVSEVTDVVRLDI